MISRPRDHYQVPRRFGLRAVLVIVALFAALLSVVKWTDVSPVVLFFYASFVLVVGGAQVVFERSPRLGSILAGAAFLPILKFAAFEVEGRLDEINVGPFMGLVSADGSLVYTLVFGALYGYLGGTLLASLFMALDAFQMVARWRDKQGRLPTEAS